MEEPEENQEEEENKQLSSIKQSDRGSVDVPFAHSTWDFFIDRLFVDRLFVDHLFVDHLFVDHLLVAVPGLPLCSHRRAQERMANYNINV